MGRCRTFRILELHQGLTCGFSSIIDNMLRDCVVVSYWFCIQKTLRSIRVAHAEYAQHHHPTYLEFPRFFMPQFRSPTINSQTLPQYTSIHSLICMFRSSSTYCKVDFAYGKRCWRREEIGRTQLIRYDMKRKRSWRCMGVGQLHFRCLTQAGTMIRTGKVNTLGV